MTVNLQMEATMRKKIPTNYGVYRSILDSHIADLTVYESFSDPDGSFHGGAHGEMLTVWGFKNANIPLLGARTTFDLEYVSATDTMPAYNRRINEKHEFWLISHSIFQEDDD